MEPGQASESGVPAALGQRQPAGGDARQSPYGAGEAHSEAAQREHGPHSIAVRQVAAVREANRLGLMPRIQQMALHGKTDAELAMAIGGRLSSSDIGLVRHHLGIGSLGDLTGGDEMPFAHGGRAGRASGGGASGGGASDDTLRADAERAGLSFSPRAAGGRARGGRVLGELTEANKATHKEVGYVARTPRKKQRRSLCSKYIATVNGGPACKKVASPIGPEGWCKRFVRDTTFTTEEIRTAARDAVARGASRDAVLKRLRELGVATTGV
jgi:hypothetical protein